MIRAMYALSGDPPTNGHAWVINEINKVADEIHIGLAVNPDKKFMFDIDERVAMMLAITNHIKQNVFIHNIHNEFLVRYARCAGCTHLIRGIRSVKDYEYEKTMAMVNSDLEPEITTLFLFSPPALEAVSSSFVKGLIGLKGWEEVAAKYVHPCVLKKLHPNRFQEDLLRHLLH